MDGGNRERRGKESRAGGRMSFSFLLYAIHFSAGRNVSNIGDRKEMAAKKGRGRESGARTGRESGGGRGRESGGGEGGGQRK